MFSWSKGCCYYYTADFWTNYNLVLEQYHSDAPQRDLTGIKMY